MAPPRRRAGATLAAPCVPARQGGIGHGEKDTREGDAEAEGLGAVGDGDSADAAGLQDQRGRHVPCRRREGRRLGGCRGDVGRGGLRAAVPGEGARRAGLPGPRLGPRPPRARPGRRDAQAPARGVPRRAEVEGRALHVLRPVLQALSGVHGEAAGGEPRRPQGGKDTRGRLGRADDVARRPGRGRGVEGPPVRRLPALQPPVLRRADAGHGAGYMAALPRARLRLHRRVDALHRAGQPEGRRDQAPARGRGRAERGVPRDGRPLRLGGDARARRGPARQAERGERGLAGRPGDHRGAAGRGLHRLQRAQEGRRGQAGGAQRPPVHQARGHAPGGLRGAGAAAAETAARRALRGLRVGVRPQGAEELPCGVQAQLLLGEPSRGREDGGPQGHGRHPGGVPRRRAPRHAPAVPGLRAQPLLDACRRPPRGQVVLRLGRGAHTQVGRPRRAVLQGGGGPHLPARGLRGAGLRRRPRRAQARAPLHEAEARAGVRAGAGLGRAIPQVQAPEAHLGDQPGPGLPRACR